MWFTALIPLITGLFGSSGPIGQYFKTKAAQQQAAADLALQVEKDKFALSTQMAQAEVESEKNKLDATSQTFKAISFFLLNVPIIITCLSAGHGKDLWDNLALVPVWYAQLYVSVVFVIWGLPVVSNATSVIFGAIQSAWDARNQGKIAKIAAIGQQQNMNLEQAKKQIFDIMREVNGNITQAQVTKLDPLLDQALPTLGEVVTTTATTTKTA